MFLTEDEGNMEKTVDEGFRKLHGSLTPTRGEAQAAKSQRASIETCLKQKFGITRFVATGSFGNGTSVRGYSDIDYFACIPAKNLQQNSFTTLQEVEKVLRDHLPGMDIAIRPPAVRVSFGTNAFESIEIVPADLISGEQGSVFIYEIADGAGGWRRSSPDIHNTYIREIDMKLGGKVKPLISLVKAWNYYHSALIRSFYLEIYVAQYAAHKKSLVFSRDVETILKMLRQNQLAAFKDPKGITQSIVPCFSEAQKSHALAKLEFACTWAEKAQEAETAGRISDAFHGWNRVFARKFPSYE